MKGGLEYLKETRALLDQLTDKVADEEGGPAYPDSLDSVVFFLDPEKKPLISKFGSGAQLNSGKGKVIVFDVYLTFGSTGLVAVESDYEKSELIKEMIKLGYRTLPKDIEWRVRLSYMSDKDFENLENIKPIEH